MGTGSSIVVGVRKGGHFREEEECEVMVSEGLVGRSE